MNQNARWNSETEYVLLDIWFKTGKTANVRINVTLRRVRVTTVSVEKQPWLSNIQCACALLYCHRWLLWLYRIFPHCLINDTTFGIKLLNIKCVFWSSLQHLFETFLILRRTERYIIRYHKSKHRGFDSRWSHLDFSSTLLTEST
jgi:hypothetical protein